MRYLLSLAAVGLLITACADLPTEPVKGHTPLYWSATIGTTPAQLFGTVPIIQDGEVNDEVEEVMDEPRSLETALQMQMYDVWVSNAHRLATDMAKRGTDYLELTISIITAPDHFEGRDGMVSDDGAELFLTEFKNELWKANVFMVITEESEERVERRAAEMSDGSMVYVTFTILEYSMRLR